MKSLFLLLFFFSTSLFYNHKCYAQKIDSLARVREVGIGLYSFNSFGLLYRWGTEKKLNTANINLTFKSSIGNEKENKVTYYTSDTSKINIKKNQTIPINFYTGIGYGTLKQKEIYKKLGFLYGFYYGLTINILKDKYETTNFEYNSNDVLLNYLTTVVKTNTLELRPLFGINLGLSYKLSNSLSLNALVVPSFYYNFLTSTVKENVTYKNEILGTKKEITQSHKPKYAHTLGISNVSNSGIAIAIIYRWKN